MKRKATKLLSIMLACLMAISLLPVMSLAADPVEAGTHTVTFDSRGGTEVKPQTVESGKLAAEPAEPTRDGYQFDGWYTRDSVDSGDDYTQYQFDFENTLITSDITLYAGWMKHVVAGVYDATNDKYELECEGGVYTINGDEENTFTNSYTTLSDLYVDDMWMVMEAVPAEGYVFLEWRKGAPDGEAVTDSVGLVLDEADEFNETYYAVFAVTRTVTFDTNGHGTISADSLSVPHGKAIADVCPEEYLTPDSGDGPLFFAWSRESDNDPDKWFDLYTPIDSDVTLYAIWLEGVSQVALTMGGSDVPAAGQSPSVSTVAVSEGACTLDGAFWGTTPTEAFTGTIFDNDTSYWLMAELMADDGYAFNENYWRANLDRITLNGRPADGVDNGGGSANRIMTAYWRFPVGEPPMVTVSFDMNGHGEQVAPLTIDKGMSMGQALFGNYEGITPADIRGWGFDGWYTDAALTEEAQMGANVDKDTTLYAKWLDYSVSIEPAAVTLIAEEGYAEEAVSRDITATAVGAGEVEFILGGFKEASMYEQFSLVVGGMTATVAPRGGLTQGTYRAVVMIEDYYSRFAPVEVPVTFTVTAASPGTGGGGGGSAPAAYPVASADAMENGSVTVTPASARAGRRVTVTPKPDAGYETDSVTVMDKNGDTVPVTKNADGTYSFTMPGGRVTVAASFKKSAPGGDHDCPSKHLKDVDVNAWYHEYVDRVVEKGLMEGVADDLFAPNVTTSRAMIVTILHRLEGKPSAGGKASFSDVAEGAWYADAVAWAEENNIVNGYGNGRFGPTDNVTREQLAAIMFRYARHKGYDVSVGEDTNILSYDDVFTLSEYAIPAMQWACGAGIIEGRTPSTLDPKDNATRAEAAAILVRFMENVK